MTVIGIDTGGTFTDVILLAEDGGLSVHKLPSTPSDPAAAVLAGLRAIGAGPGAKVTHGSTVATNALLERKGAPTALVATKGFTDVLEIGRQTRPLLYSLSQTRPAPLVPAEMRLGLEERVAASGRPLKPPSPQELDRVAGLVKKSGARAVAVVLLHAYANGDHERLMGQRLAELGIPVSLSHEVLPEFREFERTCATVVNAYVRPLMSRYLESIEAETGAENLLVMQSNGGAISAGEAMRMPIATVLSGPAGGVLGAARAARTAGLDRFISFDMGGTSTDVSLYDRAVAITGEADIAGLPIRTPMLRIHTVGAGGGSIAGVDDGGALAVGPESAGAEPGPVCYGRGKRLTVTDANLFLGRLMPEAFLGGNMRLDPARIKTPMAALAKRLGIGPLEAAAGIITVVNAHMQRAIRLISVEKGVDARELGLVSFGGAGGLHAAELARALGMNQVLIPPQPGLLSAWGMALADVVAQTQASLLRPTAQTSHEELQARLEPMAAEARRRILAHGIGEEDIAIHPSLEMRYLGQSFEVRVPLAPDFEARFHAEHERLFGASHPGRPTQVVNLGLRAVGTRPTPDPRPAPPAETSIQAARAGRQRIWTGQSWADCPVYDRALLGAGHETTGPALVTEYSSTTYLPPGFRLRVDEWLNLRLTPGEEAGR